MSLKYFRHVGRGISEKQSEAYNWSTIDTYNWITLSHRRLSPRSTAVQFSIRKRNTLAIQLRADRDILTQQLTAVVFAPELNHPSIIPPTRRAEFTWQRAPPPCRFPGRIRIGEEALGKQVLPRSKRTPLSDYRI